MNADINAIEILPSFGTKPSQLARYFASGQRLTSVEFAEAVNRQHKNLIRDVRGVLDKLSNENKDFLAIDVGCYTDDRGREQPLYIFGQEALEFFMMHIDVDYRCSLLRELYLYREHYAELLKRERDVAEAYVATLPTFDKRSPYYGRTDLRALQRLIASR